MSAIFGEVLRFGQPDGGEIQLRVFGDEHYARYETLESFTVVYDAEYGVYCYASLVAGVLRSTGVPAQQPPPANVARHLQESPEVINSKAQARRMRRAAIAGGQAGDRVVRTFGPNNGLLEGRIVSTGVVKGLTILVNFQDVTSTVTRPDVENLLNATNYTHNGNLCSAREYFLRVSSGKLDYTNVVVGPFTLSRNRQFYVNNLLVAEALQAAVASGLDLKQFDSRNEGIVDALNVMYAGQTQYAGDLWPHNHHIYLRFDDVRTDLYLLTGLGRTPADLSIGTFCHENGHLLCRFPDMYDYGQRDEDSVPSAGIGHYCLMGSGNHLDFGRSPSPVCGYLRELAGWCDEEVELGVGGSFQAHHGDYKTVMKYRTGRPNEYFLIENRTKMDMDRALPSSGLAVYHCDILGSNEFQEGSRARHYQCALLQADGRNDLERNVNQGDAIDLFDETAGVALSSQSNPHSREWDGRDSGLVVSDITSPGQSISFSTGQAVPARTVAGETSPMVTIPDNVHAGVSSTISIAEPGVLESIRVTVDIEHSFIGDLRVTLTAPSGRSTVLHAHIGGSTDNLMTTYDSASPGVLTDMVGQPIQGTWRLNATDRVKRDVGRLRRWAIELTTATINGATRPSPAPSTR